MVTNPSRRQPRVCFSLPKEIFEEEGLRAFCRGLLLDSLRVLTLVFSRGRKRERGIEVMESNSMVGYLENNGNHAPFDGPLKVIIDTDPGIGAPSCPFLDALASVDGNLCHWYHAFLYGLMLTSNSSRSFFQSDFWEVLSFCVFRQGSCVRKLISYFTVQNTESWSLWWNRSFD